MNTNQWRDDLQFFESEVQKHHKNPYHLVSTEQFTNAVAKLSAMIPQLKNHEIIVGLQSLAAMIGDGHTFLATRDIHHFFPLEMFWFQDELRVVRTVAAYKEALGMRLVEINGVALSEVNARIQNVIPQGENRWYLLAQSPKHIISAEVLASLGITSSLEQAAFTFVDEQNKQFSLTLLSVAPNTNLDWISLAQKTLLYQQHLAEPFWFVDLPEAQSVYVHFRGYNNLEQHAQKLWKFVDDQTPQKLIIDMRQNGGGNYTLARSHLIYEIQRRAEFNNLGRLFVVIGRATFSAAMTNATDFRRETAAILVGEPTGARPKGYQENYWLTLPNSGLRASVACRYYKFQDVDTPTVLPDHTIEPLWSDYLAGRDPVLEWIFSYNEPASAIVSHTVDR